MDRSICWFLSRRQAELRRCEMERQRERSSATAQLNGVLAGAEAASKERAEELVENGRKLLQVIPKSVRFNTVLHLPYFG